MTRYRVALWVLLGGKLLGAWGLTWDIQWHLLIGRDTFWIPPHLMMYSGVTAGFLVAVLVLALDTRDRRRGVRRRGGVTMLGLTSTRGIHLAAWGVALLLLAAPIDDLWHRLFGLDVTLWSPPHLLGLLGSAVNTIGTLLIAVEAYPPGARMRLAALVLGGGLLWGGVRVVLEPAWLTAYTNGGVAFHMFAMLGTLLLPLALIPGTRLLDRRWAPVALVVVSLAASLVGEQIARAGFAIIRPVPVITEEIKKDPTSPIALAAEIREKNRGAGPPWVVRLMLPVVAAAVRGGGGPAPAARRRVHRLRRDDARAVRLVHRPDAGVSSDGAGARGDRAGPGLHGDRRADRIASRAGGSPTSCSPRRTTPAPRRGPWPARARSAEEPDGGATHLLGAYAEQQVKRQFQTFLRERLAPRRGRQPQRRYGNHVSAQPDGGAEAQSPTRPRRSA